MLKLLVQSISLIILTVEPGDAARILGVVPIPSFSHQIVFRPIWTELAKRGHDLTILTTDPMRNANLSNIKEIDLSFSYQLWNEKYNVVNVLEENQNNLFKVLRLFEVALEDIADQQLSHPEVQTLIHNTTEHFDLVIVEFLYPAMFAFSNHFNCPYIGMSSLDLPYLIHGILGNPVHPVLYPEFFLPFEEDLTLAERLISTLFINFNSLYHTFGSTKGEEVVARKHFGENLPPMEDIIKNVSLMFINVDPVFYKRPLGPAFIPIGGGIHITPLKPLPQELKEYLDSAENGVIYFSFGTNVNTRTVDEAMRSVFLNTFRKLPYKVLWKFELDDLPHKPDNVKIAKWLPQQDILRHPNVKLFITQGGLQSIEEAIFANVPLIGIPFIADQAMNVAKLDKKGFGLAIDRKSITEEKLAEAINEVITNPKYKNRITEMSKLSRDQPMTGVEKAVWWIEYVLRHKGAKFLRNHAMDIPLYQYYLLDVLSILSIVVFIIIFILVKMIQWIWRKFVYKNRQKIKSQ